MLSSVLQDALYTAREGTCAHVTREAYHGTVLTLNKRNSVVADHCEAGHGTFLHSPGRGVVIKYISFQKLCILRVQLLVLLCSVLSLDV